MKQALSLIGVSFLSVVSSLAADKKPNIILILADDMRASGMNFLGKEQVQTPNLDKLAGESTVFTNAHIMGGVMNGYNGKQSGRRDGYSYAYSYSYYNDNKQGNDA